MPRFAVLLMPFLLVGCMQFFGLEDEEPKCGAKAVEKRDYTLADAEAGFEKRSWDVKLEDVCGREHHSASFEVLIDYSRSDCDEDKVAITGGAYTAFGLEPYEAVVTRHDLDRDDAVKVEGTISGIGYGQQADVSGAKPMLVVVEAVYDSDEGPEKADRCLMELVDTVHLEVAYSKALA